MSFHVGQKVVVVGYKADKLPPPEHMPQRLDRGRVYTIRDIDYRAVEYHGVPAIRVEEVINKSLLTTVGQWELAYDPRAFRPVQTRSTETGMSILRKVAADAANRRNLVVAR